MKMPPIFKRLRLDVLNTIPDSDIVQPRLCNGEHQDELVPNPHINPSSSRALGRPVAAGSPFVNGNEYSNES